MCLTRAYGIDNQNRFVTPQLLIASELPKRALDSGLDKSRQRLHVDDAKSYIFDTVPDLSRDSNSLKWCG